MSARNERQEHARSQGSVQHRVAVVLAILLIGASLFAGEGAVVPSEETATGRYLVVLAPRGETPDFGEAGATVEYARGRYHVIRVAPQAIEGLRRNPNVLYIQRWVPPAEARAVHAAAARVRTIAASAVVPQVAPASATWTSGPYQYDGSGNIRAIGAHAYGYDALGRLVEAHYGVAGGPATVTERYGYDGFGNLIQRTGGPNSPGTIAVDGATNRLAAAAGAVYDGAGNLVRFGIEERNYDPGRMMRRRTRDDGGAVYYVYNAWDERIAAIDERTFGTWTIRGVDGRVLRQFTTIDSSFQLWSWQEDEIYREGTLLAAQRIPEVGGTIHFAVDHLGTPRQITSGAGEELSRHDYDPFGTELTELTQLPIRGWEPNAFQFTGHERDYHSGWYAQNVDYDDYMHARYYNPALGRFASVDPVLDVKRAMREPQAWNRYSYVVNNPISRIDPDGRVDQNYMPPISDDLEERASFDWGVAKRTFVAGAVSLGVVAGPAGWRFVGALAMNWARANPGTVQQATHAAEGLLAPPSGGISIGAGQLQSKFKHAVDFGVIGTFNRANAAAFGEAIQKHVQGSGTVAINGAYRSSKNLVTYYLDKATSRVVITDRKGNFVSAYKASERQVKDILEKAWGF